MGGAGVSEQQDLSPIPAVPWGAQSSDGSPSVSPRRQTWLR